MQDSLTVYINQHKAGTLWQDDQSRMSFQYSDEWLVHPETHFLSISLPLRPEVFPEHECYSYFTNLLPEGKVLTTLSMKLGIPETDKFRLLRAIGGDCAGAVSLYPDGQRPPAPDEYLYESLSEDLLLGKIEELKDNPFLALEEKRLSLAGAMEKLPVRIEDGVIRLPLNGTPTTHILKMPVADLLGVVTNEAFCMTLAGRVGLNVPEVDVLKIGTLNVYAIKRYDRVTSENGIRRLIQEDFCQSLGINPQHKYDLTYGQCFEVIRAYSSNPIADSRQLLQSIIFNGLIGNSDGHAKNISLLHDENGTRLAPFYDLVSTQIYPGFTQKMPVKLAGKKRDFRHLEIRHFEMLAREIKMKPSIVLDVVRDMTQKVFESAQPAADEFKSRYGSVYAVDEINLLINNHADAMATLFLSNPGTDPDLAAFSGPGMR